MTDISATPTARAWLAATVPGLPRRAHVLTVLAAIAAWGAFGWCWWSVARRGGLALTAVMLALASAAAVLVLTRIWVLHNRRIYRRKGPRRQVPTARYDYGRDRLGRPVVYHAGLDRAREVVIEIVDGAKVYRAERAA